MLDYGKNINSAGIQGFIKSGNQYKAKVKVRRLASNINYGRQEQDEKTKNKIKTQNNRFSLLVPKVETRVMI